MKAARAYRDRNYQFGELLYAYRSRMVLTQAELAEQIGVHWRTVQNWETGKYYPKADVLQKLIAVCLRYKAFVPGNEREEAIVLWQQASHERPHIQASFDEDWFAHTLAMSVEPSASAIPSTKAEETIPSASPLAAVPKTNAIIDWGEVIAIRQLVGREQEMETLRSWVVDEECHVVTILGLGGIGKSSLAMTFARQVVADSGVGDFDVVLFRSLQNAPPLAQVLDQSLHAISAQQVSPPELLADKIALLVQLFRERRCLLILDNFETLLQPETLTGTYRTSYADYALLLRALSEREHSSCLLLTTREKPAELGPLEGRNAPVRTLRLGGLTDNACQTILEAKDIIGTTTDIERLVQLYGGNPLALNLVSEPIRDLFGGDVGSFLATGDAFFGGVGKLLEQQFRRSTPLEQSLLYWLAIERELVPFNLLVANIGENMTQRDLVAALESLRRRMQIERSPDRPAFTLQPIILEYMTEQLVSAICQEVVDGKPRLLRSHALMQAHATDSVRDSQERLILSPLLKQLQLIYGDSEPLARQLLGLLDIWREQPLMAQGYGPGNVVNLLRLLRGDLRGLNLANLALREVFWQGVEAQGSSLANAWVRDNVFTETFGIVHAVTASASGMYWAASSINGAVQVWCDEGCTSYLSIPAHTKHVKSLALSPDEQILATGSWDCTVKLWDMTSGALIYVLEGHRDFVQCVSFSPDGRWLASVSDDRTMRIWDIITGKSLKTIDAHIGNTYGVSWSADGKWLASCGSDHRVHVWDVASGECVQTFTGHTRLISKVAFSPDSRMLASGGYDRTLRIWDLDRGECIKIFAEHTSSVMAIAWNDDGRMIASCSYDATIRLWELHQDTAQRILLGHSASVNSIAFSPQGTMLLSGSDDQTIRVWDVESGLCVRVIEGYGLFFVAVAWSPDGRHLLSANNDTTLTLWNAEDGTVKLTLRGHTHTIYGAEWSPDGRHLVSNGFDQTIRIWDATNGVCVRVIPAHIDSVNRMVKWSPDGRWLACAGRDRAVRIWDIDLETFRWVGKGHTGPINEVAWSPDGERLASCSEDHTVRVWRSEDGVLLHMLTGHESSVAWVAWSPDGRRLASCGGGGTVGELFVWDAQKGTRINSFVGHDSVILRVAWSQDGKGLFSGGMTGAIHWWDVESGVNLQTRQSHQGWIRSLSVSPDGSVLVTSGEDGVIHFWEITHAQLLHTLRVDRPYERMDIRGLTGISKAQRAALVALGAVEQSESLVLNLHSS